MILEEFDLEKQLKLEKKEERTLILALTQKLLADSRIDDLKRATENPDFLELLLQEYGIS